MRASFISIYAGALERETHTHIYIYKYITDLKLGYEGLEYMEHKWE